MTDYNEDFYVTHWLTPVFKRLRDTARDKAIWEVSSVTPYAMYCALCEAVMSNTIKFKQHTVDIGKLRDQIWKETP